jgi:hypothetical protein
MRRETLANFMGTTEGNSSKATVFTGAGITLVIFVLVGKLLLILSLFYLAGHFSFGTPCVLPRVLVGSAVGFLFLVSGAKLAGNSWVDSATQAPHYCAAVASIPFLFLVIRHVTRFHEISLFPTGILTFLALVALVTWWLRSRTNSTPSGELNS